MKNITIGGIALSDYRIVWDETVGADCAARTGGIRCLNPAKLMEGDRFYTAAETAANDLRLWIDDTCGVTLEASGAADSVPTKGCIVVGALPWHGVDTASYGDCRLYAENGNIYIDASDILGLAVGASYLARFLGDACGEINDTDISFTSSAQTRSEYEHDVEALLVPYRFTHNVSEKRSTVTHKREVLEEPNGRAFIIAHRGEHKYYPENSLEAAISTWRCGSDSMEVDIVKSKDGVWMCMHDKSLTRTTNADEYIGREGFPDSPMLCDWTYEQLRTLRLVDTYGKLTPFIIPTLEEIFTAANGRIFLHLDKGFSYDDDIFPMMDEMGICDCVYLCNHIKLDGIIERNMRYADKGFRMPSMVRTWSPEESVDTVPKILENADKMTPAAILRGDYTAYSETDFAVAEKYKGQIRVGAWFIRRFDNEELWREGRERGINIMMTNHPLDIIRLGI
ncbi:MAG: glycerophosphodiester phosphodiesterase family protein [Clostridia bacterium]|nr:glycerophosphodiester phosphodiesterase family protein [Clostridia bacterium]